MNKQDTIKNAILELVSEMEPIGWRGLEIRLRVPRETFKDGYTLMTYLEEMVAEGMISKTSDGGYVRSDI